MRRAIFLSVAVIAIAPAAAMAQSWSDDFDSYANGTDLHGVSNWTGWWGDPAATAFVSNAQSLSAPHSVDINGPSDLVAMWSEFTSGQWTFSAMQYIPDGSTGSTFFLMLNTYDNTPNNNSWSVQLVFDNALGTVQSQGNGPDPTAPIVYDAWTEIRVEIDLDADTQDIYYAGALLDSQPWSNGVSGSGVTEIAALDLFANGASPVYYDNLSLVPEPASCLLVLLGAGLMLRRRR